MSAAKPTTPADAGRPTIGRSEVDALRLRNVIFFVLDTAFFSFALALVDLTSVMPSLLSHLTRQPVLIGLLGSAQTACWLLPQLLVARIVAARRRKLPIVLATTTLSRLSWLLLLGALAAPDLVGPVGTLLAAYLAVSLFWLLDGVAVLAWYDVVAKAVPATLRGRLFGLMSLSGVFGVAGGFVVQQVLGNPSLPYPADYRALLAGALVVFIVGLIPLYLVREPPGEPAPAPEPFGVYLRRLPSLLREHRSFRRLVGIQLLVGSAGLALPFYAPFGVQRLHLPESDVGTFVVGMTFGAMAGGMIWGFLGDHGRKEVAIRSITALAVVAPALALSLGLLAPGLPGTFVGLGLALALFFLGGNRSGWVAYANYVMDVAEPAERPVLIGLMNTLGGTLAVMPPLGGLLAGWLGYEATFAVATLPAIAAFVLSLGLRPTLPVRAPHVVG